MVFLPWAARRLRLATQASGDGGVDIIAHRDELGFEEPIIKVQCKPVLGTIGRPDVQRLNGAIETGERGLFVTLGNFSPDARTYERTKPNLRLLDGSDLIGLVYAYYDKFDPRYRCFYRSSNPTSPGPYSAAKNREARVERRVSHQKGAQGELL